MPLSQTVISRGGTNQDPRDDANNLRLSPFEPEPNDENARRSSLHCPDEYSLHLMTPCLKTVFLIRELITSRDMIRKYFSIIDVTICRIGKTHP